MKRKHLIYISVGLVVAGILLYVAKYSRDFYDIWLFATTPDMSRVEITSTDGKHHLYLKQRWWGLTGDSSVAVISESRGKFSKPDYSTEYVYNALYKVFYSFENDTLVVHVPGISRVPPDLNTPIAVLQIQYTSSEYYDLLKNYGDKGLKVIPPPH